MPAKFVHLHVHSHYSLLQALPKLDELVSRAKELGMPAVALTDYGSMYGAIEFYKECKKQGVKPIIGIEAYMARFLHTDRRPRIDDRPFSIVLLAETLEGYKNLMKLTSIAHLDGFYYKPRIDKPLLRQYGKGIIALLGDPKSDMVQALEMGEMGKAEALVQEYRDVIGAENFFLELRDHRELDEQVARNADIVKLARATSTPIVATKDVHYLTRDDAEAQDLLTCISSGKIVTDEGRVSMLNVDYSFVDADAMVEAFKDLPDAILNTVKIAERCNVELTLGKWHFPDVKIPEGKTYDEVLREESYEGAAKKVPEITQVMKDRLDYELDIIKTKGYASYFLCVSDYIRWAKARGIVTTTRGSAAGSFVSYAIDIVPVNPLTYKLPFERFLNPFRPSAPDIDADFADSRRDEVIQYAVEKYGRDKVAQIGTFGTMAARAAAKDVGRALGLSFALCNRVSQLIPVGAQGFPMTIKKALETTPELKQLMGENPDVRRMLELAQKVEGCSRHVSVHAAGVVISPIPLTEFCPLQRDPKGGGIITQYDMHSVEDAGVLKMDFLGIRNLSTIGHAVEIIKKTKGADIDIANLPLEDAKTYKLLADGDTIGLFQLNGSGMTRYLKELRPSNIFDIMAMVALYRPGPLESIPQFIERKHNPALITYLDPRLSTILDMSYGVITYQDDVMLTAIHLAGYNWEEADKLRKAMGKKIPAEMAGQKGKLIAGFIKNGLSEHKANQLWELIEPFAAYGFNKCLTGDTKIMDPSDGSYSTLRDLHDRGGRGSVVALQEDHTLCSEERREVFENGIKPVFELVTRSGRRIKATTNHPFFTKAGWVRLDELQTGHQIAVVRRRESEKLGEMYWDEIESITPKGEEMTYDLEVPGSHNFVANDIIVHNSHAAAYAMVAFQTAYLKANYPSEFMTAVLTAESGDADTIAEVVTACAKMGIKVLPPDVNSSGKNFTYIDDKKIRFGLLAIKNLGSDIVDAVIAERDVHGEFKDITDLASRGGTKNFNKKSLEALVKSGALDALGERNALLASMDQILMYHKMATRDVDAGQSNLFAADPAMAARSGVALRDVPAATKREKLAWERELLGLYVSEHPFGEFAQFFDGLLTPLAELPSKKGTKGLVRVGGTIMDVREIVTKNGDAMAFVKIEDTSGGAEVVVFPSVFKTSPQTWVRDVCLMVEGKYNEKDGEAKLLAESATVLTADSLEEVRHRLAMSTGKRHAAAVSATLSIEKELVCIAVPAKMPMSLANEMKRIFAAHPGNRRVILLVGDGEARKKIETSFAISFTSDAIAAIERIVGRGAVKAGEGAK